MDGKKKLKHAKKCADKYATTIEGVLCQGVEDDDLLPLVDLILMQICFKIESLDLPKRIVDGWGEYMIKIIKKTLNRKEGING